MAINSEVNNTNEKARRTSFLADEPVDQDELGPHDRIAHAVADTISKDEHGKAIALEGTWGSGKSTVVELIKRKLQAGQRQPDVPVLFFVFDAWAHKGDPLRLAFLQELRDFLLGGKEKFKVSDLKWEEGIEDLEKPVDTSTVVSEPVPTRAGVIMGISAVLMPFGGIILSKYLASDYTAPWVHLIRSSAANIFGPPPLIDWSHWLVCIIGCALLIGPIITAAGTWIYWRPHVKFWTKEFWRQYRKSKKNVSIASLFLNTRQEISTQTTLRTPDPTSVDFRRIFKDILEAVLKGSKQRLVVVVDNLDRVGSREAIAIWSTMRTFFDPWNEDDPGEMDWSRRLWLLVPYDREGISKIWESSGPAHWEHEKELEEEETQDGIRYPLEETAASFIDKTFSVKFPVPPPIIVKLREYVSKRLTEAFPDCSEQSTEDFDVIYRLFHMKRQPTERPVTPRDVKLFINEVVAYHRQWSDEIPLCILALYVLHKQEILNRPTMMLETAVVHTPMRNIVSHRLDWVGLRQYFAALHYNVQIKDSLHVLLNSPVEEALAAGEVETLIDLYKTTPGFLDVVEQVAEQAFGDWAPANPQALVSSAKVFRTFQEHDIAFPHRLYQHLFLSVASVKKWSKMDEQVGVELVELMRHVHGSPHETEWRRLVAGILESVSKTPLQTRQKSTEPHEEAITEWSSGSLRVLDYLHQKSETSLLNSHFRLHFPEKWYVQCLVECSKDPAREHLTQYLRPNDSASDVIHSVQQPCSSGEFSEETYTAIKAMFLVNYEWSWGPVVTALDQGIRVNMKGPTESLNFRLRILEHLAYGVRDEGAEASLRKLCEDGQLLVSLSHARSQNVPELEAASILPIMAFTPEMAIHLGSHEITQGHKDLAATANEPLKYGDLLRELTELTLEFLDLEQLVQKLSGQVVRMQNLIWAVLKTIPLIKDSASKVPLRFLLAQYAKVANFKSEAFLTRVLEHSASQGNLMKELEEHGFEVDLAGLYLVALEQRKNSQDSDVLAFILRGLREIDGETWITELRSEGDLVKLVLKLIEDQETLDLPMAFQDALLQHAQGISGDEKLPAKFKQQWTDLLLALGHEDRTTFLRGVRDGLIRCNRATRKARIQLYGDALLDSGVWDDKEKSDEIVRHFYVPITSEGEIIALEYLAQLVERSEGIIKQAKPETKRTFKKRLEEIMRDDELTDQEYQILKSIRSNIDKRFK